MLKDPYPTPPQLSRGLYLYGLADRVERAPLPERLTKSRWERPWAGTKLRPREGPTLMAAWEGLAQVTSEGCDLCHTNSVLPRIELEQAQI